MRDSKLYEWLKRLPVGEQNEFLRYVELLGGKNRKDLYRLLDLFLATVLRGKGLSREEFFKAWQPGAAYDANLLRKRMTAIKKLLDDYLATTELLRQPISSAIYFLKALQHRGWADWIAQEHKAAIALLDASPMDENHFLQALQIEDCYLNLVLESPRKWTTPVLQPSLDYTDLHFLVQKLRYACAAFNIDRIVGTQHALGMLPMVLAYVAAHELHLPPLVRIYYRTYLLLTEPENPIHFQALQNELACHADNITPPLARELYKFAVNHCIARLNAGEKQFASAIQDIYQSMLQTEILLHHGMMEAAELKNMIALVLQTGGVDLAERLLHEFGPKLSPESDPAALQYNEALISYHRGDFSKARRLCDIVLRDARDPFYILDARLCLWRASYELGDWDYSLTQYDAFRMFLSRTPHLSKSRIDNYKQFGACFFSLLRILHKYQEINKDRRNTELERLMAKVDTAPDTANIAWLRKKIKEALAT